MIICAHCSQETTEDRNFCTHCNHKIRDLTTIKLGAGCRHNPAIETFWRSGDPSVFASKGALDYNPENG